MATLNKIVPCLWFDSNGEEAANFYVKVFGEGSRITQITRYSEAGKEHHGRPVGSVMTVSFELRGQEYMALNAGPQFKFTEAVSFQVMCETQAEVDYFWERLTEGGQEVQCSWLKDKFGLSWQIVPTIMMDLLKDHTSEKTKRAMAAMMGMVKLDIAALKKAYEGK